MESDLPENLTRCQLVEVPCPKHWEPADGFVVPLTILQHLTVFLRYFRVLLESLPRFPFVRSQVFTMDPNPMVGAYGHPFLLPIREGQQGKEIMAALQDAD